MPFKKRIKSLIAGMLGLSLDEIRAAPVTLDEEQALIEKGYITSEELSRLKSGRRTDSLLLGKPIGITDSFWYLHSLKELFLEEIYRFRSLNQAPYILDCGSNIGLSVIYFKRLFPNARIVAFEPDTHICGLLRRNLGTFGCSDVVVKNNAVWKEETVLSFSAAGSLSGRLITGDIDRNADDNLTRVPAVRLRDWLNEKVDFLKMDIEGPEAEVLEDCAGSLTNVENLFVEYHSDPEVEQQLDRLLAILRSAGFRVYIKESWNNLPLPFLRKDYRPCYDLQLNIFAYRSSGA